MANVQPAETPIQYKLFPMMGLLGWVLILASFIIGLFTLAPTAGDYFGENDKLTRDCALVQADADGDGLVANCSTVEYDDGQAEALQDDLATLTSTNRWKEPLTFLGVALFMCGIAMEFSTIPSLLKNRGQVMAAAYQQITRS